MLRDPSLAVHNMEARKTKAARIIIGAVLLVLAVITVIGSGGGGDSVTIPPFWSEGGVVVDDFDNDGRVEVAVAAAYIAGPPPHPGYVRVYHQSTAGAYDAPIDYRVGPDPWGLSVGDVNGDGWPDLVAATPRTVAPEPNVINDSGGISILRQDSANAGNFLSSQWVFTGGSATDAAIAQLTADALADLAVADGVLINGRALLLSQNPASLGEFLAPISLLIGSGYGSDDLAVGDINGDTRSDIVLAAHDVVAVLYQNASGGYEPVQIQTLPAGKSVSGVALEDLDGDTRTDIVVANAGNAPSGYTGDASVTILLQKAAGSFNPTNIPVADGARRVAIGDLNDDGLPDLAVISIFYQSQIPSRVSVLLQQSSLLRGEFTVHAVYDGPFSGSFVAIGDINDDKLNDIVINDGPSVLLQSAAAKGTFEPVQPLQ